MTVLVILSYEQKKKNSNIININPYIFIYYLIQNIVIIITNLRHFLQPDD